MTAAAAVAVAAATHGAAALWAARSGEPCPPISVDTRHSAALFRGERLLRIGGRPAPNAADPLSGYYRAGDGRWIHLHCDLPHHRAGVLELLGTRADPDAVARAVARHDAAILEAELQAMVLDHATGQLTAFGVLAALAHREVSGGSWHVRLSLAQTAHWLTDLGRRDTRSLVEPSDAGTAPFRRSMRSEFGELS